MDARRVRERRRLLDRRQRVRVPPFQAHQAGGPIERLHVLGLERSGFLEKRVGRRLDFTGAASLAQKNRPADERVRAARLFVEQRECLVALAAVEQRPGAKANPRAATSANVEALLRSIW